MWLGVVLFTAAYDRSGIYVIGSRLLLVTC